MRRLVEVVIMLGLFYFTAFADTKTGEKLAKDATKACEGITEVSFISSHPFGNDKEVQLFKLKNGLEILLLADPDAKVFSYQTWFRVGSADEVEGKTGLAHLMEHLMFKGTKKYPRGVFDRLLEEAGAQTNAATWIDWTFYYENLPEGKLDLVTTLEADRMENVSPSPEEFKHELEVVKNERRYRVDNDPAGQIEEKLFEKVFKSHPYAHPTIGYMEDLNHMTLKDAMDFYKKYYNPANAVVVVVGGVDPLEALTTIAKKYGKIKGHPVKREPIVKPEIPVCAKIETVPQEVATQTLYILFVGPSLSEPLYPASQVLAEVLFGMESARLKKELVDDLKIADSVDGMIEGLRQAGFMEIIVTMKPGKDANEALKVIRKTIDDIRVHGLSDEDLEKARNLTEAGFIKGVLRKSSIASQLGFFEVTANDYRLFFKQVEGIRQVDNEDLRKVVSKYFLPIHGCTMISVPAKGEK